MKGLIRLLQGILTLVWVALLAVSVFLLAGTKDHEMPRVSEWAAYTVPDSSMEPELSEGDVAIIGMGKAGEPGDGVLIADALGRPVLSRIIGTTEDQLIFKADGTEETTLGREEDVLGVCTGYLEGFGPMIGFLGSIPGIVAVALAGILLIILPGLLLRTPKPKPPRREPPHRESPRREPTRREPTRQELPRRQPPRSGYTPRH